MAKPVPSLAVEILSYGIDGAAAGAVSGLLLVHMHPVLRTVLAPEPWTAAAAVLFVCMQVGIAIAMVFMAATTDGSEP
jgi:hypothetical protein